MVSNPDLVIIWSDKCRSLRDFSFWCFGLQSSHFSLSFEPIIHLIQAFYSSFNAILLWAFYLLLAVIFPNLCLTQLEHVLVTVDTHFRDTFSISPTSLWAQFMYYIIFYSFKHGPSPCNILGKLRECRLKDMSRFHLDLLHEPNSCVLPSGQRTLVAPLAHGGGLVPKIPTLKEPLCAGWLWPNFLASPFFGLKHIVDPKWLALSTAITKCRLQGLAMSRKHQPMNLGHSISQIM